MYSLAEQPQIPYSISDTLWSPGSAPNLWWDLEKLHTWSKHLPWTSSQTQPDHQTPLTQRGQGQGCPGPWAALAAPHLANRDGWDTRRGPGLSQRARIHCQDPTTSQHFSSREWGGSSSGTVVSALSRVPADNKYSPLPSLPESWRLRMKLHKHWVNKTILWTSQTLFNFL